MQKEITESLRKFYQDEARQENLEHRDVLLAISSVLKTKEGQQIFSYLFKNLDVTCVPDKGMKGEDLQEYLGFLRAGNSIYKLVCEAESEKGASLLARLERKRYEYANEQYRIENGN